MKALTALSWAAHRVGADTHARALVPNLVQVAAAAPEVLGVSLAQSEEARSRADEQWVHNVLASGALGGFALGSLGARLAASGQPEDFVSVLEKLPIA